MKICPICKAEYAGGEVFCPTDGARLGSNSQLHHEPVLDGIDPLVGSTLSERYCILRQIGEGGMGIVYEAEHVVIEKRVALKVLRDDFSKRPEVVQRFRQEAKSASRIGHEHIVDISDFGETPNGQSYFVMEYLEGEDLAEVLAREGTLAPARAVTIVLQCCKALGAAHSKGIVHRDMKPENIFLTTRDSQADFVKIVDFGIAKMSDIEMEGAPGRKLTKTGMIFGTPEYMSPEQAAGKELDHRVDIYALGVILFEALTGRVPFVGDTFMGVLTQHMFEDVPTLHSINPAVVCPEELELVIMRALDKDPDTRFQTMDEFGRALAAAMDLSGGWSFTDPTSPGYGEPVRVAPRVPRAIEGRETATFDHGSRKTGLIIAALVVLLVAGGIGGWLALRPGTSAANGTEPSVGSPPHAAGNLADDGQDVVEEGPSASAGDPAPDPEPEVVPADPPQVTVSVTTSPAGANVMVDGRGAVCAPSPCSFESPAGVTIRVRARLGRRAAFREITPDEDGPLALTLSRPRTGMQSGGQTSAGMMTTPMSGDLKIPDIFR